MWPRWSRGTWHPCKKISIVNVHPSLGSRSLSVCLCLWNPSKPLTVPMETCDRSPILPFLDSVVCILLPKFMPPPKPRCMCVTIFCSSDTIMKVNISPQIGPICYQSDFICRAHALNPSIAVRLGSLLRLLIQCAYNRATSGRNCSRNQELSFIVLRNLGTLHCPRIRGIASA